MTVLRNIASTMVLSLVLAGTGCMAQPGEDATGAEPTATAAQDQADRAATPDETTSDVESTGEAHEACGFGGFGGFGGCGGFGGFGGCGFGCGGFGGGFLGHRFPFGGFGGLGPCGGWGGWGGGCFGFPGFWGGWGGGCGC